MFYSELLSSPLNSHSVKQLYGINPDAEPDRAAAIGIYPLTEAPAGYNISHYAKEGESYVAYPDCITVDEMQKVMVVRKLNKTLSELRIALGLPGTAESPQAVDGYYPLYTSEAEANFHSDDGQSNSYELSGTTYYMPAAGTESFLGNYSVP